MTDRHELRVIAMGLTFCLALMAMASGVVVLYSKQASTLIHSGSSLPSTCTSGSLTSFFIRTGATDPGVYWCSATDTWTGPLGSGGAGTPGGSDTELQYNDGGAFDGASAVTTDGTNLTLATVANTGLHLLDTDASHDLIVAPGSNITADRTLTVTTGDQDLTVDLRTGQSYSVTWTASGDPPSIGDGTLTGRYSQIGKVVFFQIGLNIGASTDTGTGTWSFSLPVAASTSINFTSPAVMFDAGTNLRMGTTLLLTSTTFGVVTDEAGNIIGAANPFTWASTDYLRVTGWYFAA